MDCFDFDLTCELDVVDEKLDSSLNQDICEALAAHGDRDTDETRFNTESHSIDCNTDRITHKQQALSRIQEVFEDIADALLSGSDQINISLHDRTTNLSQPSLQIYRPVCFPGRSADEAWKFAVLIRILELMHEALSTEVVISKRDIYYRDPALFGSQSCVDKHVDDIAFTLGAPRSSFNVTAAAKGLVAGAFTMRLSDGQSVNAVQCEGLLVPSSETILSVDMADVLWILVIEKEAAFRSLAASPFWEEISSRGIILTGKGYPDVSTRSLLRLLCTATPRNGHAEPPVYALVDFDPDGLAILATYKYGSKAQAHDNDNLKVPQMQWLGLCSEDIALGNSEHADQGLLLLSVRDRKKARDMLRNTNFDEADKSFQFNAQLQNMLMLGMKAELQLLESAPGRLDEILQNFHT